MYKTFLISYLLNYDYIVHILFERGIQRIGARIWRQIGWYTSRTTREQKKKRKKKRYTRVSRKKIFPIFPDFTVGMICVTTASFFLISILYGSA